MKNQDKIIKIGAIALIIALLALNIAQEALNQEIAFEVIVNNTNLAPTIDPEIDGTGERFANNMTYYANNSAIQLLVYAHADTTGQNAEIHVNIDGTKVIDISGKPIGVAETNNKTAAVLIPKFAAYSVNVSNYHHYEWREYPILSGKNGTLSINQTIIGSSINSSILNTKVNKTGDIIQNNFITDGEVTLGPDSTYNRLRFRVSGISDWLNFDTSTTEDSYFEKASSYHYLSVANVTQNIYSEIFQTKDGLEINFKNSTMNYFLFNHSGFYNNNISFPNKSYVDNQDNTKVNKSGDDLAYINGRQISLTNVSAPLLQRNGSVHTNKILTYYNSTGVDISSLSSDKYYTYIFNDNPDVFNLNLISFQSISDTGYPYFLGRRARGTQNTTTGSANMSGLKQNDPFMVFAGSGYDNGTGWTGSRAFMTYQADSDWNASSNAAKISWGVTKQNSVAVAPTDMYLNTTGLHVDNTPFWVNGITMQSPDGTYSCITVTNVHTLAVSASAC